MNPNDPQNSQSSTRPEWLSRLRHWERGLLILLTVAVIAMAVSLLWPKPQGVITLKPYPGHLSQTTAAPGNEATSDAMQESNLASENDPAAEAPATNVQVAKGAKRGNHAHFAKKPTHPPITNLNTAKLSQLQLLPGIGPKMAERILAYRKANGAFRNIEQIMDVKGIGPKKFEKMKPFLKV